MKLKKENEIKESFSKTLNMYPIKNLEDLYDKEGYRDEEFDKDDKGEWILQSTMNVEKDGGELVSEGMVIYMSRNTKETQGSYNIEKVNEIKNGRLKHKKIKDPIKCKINKLIMIKEIIKKKL
ncbi:Csa1 family protein, partial [Staphylococcus warneri]|uniref:Csa1 family protein n=1 Tax=Staphylococcus warneri TaxID=1292 RepID=UPI001F53F4AA